MTYEEKAFLKWQGFSVSQIEEWDDNKCWDFKREESFEVFHEGYELGLAEGRKESAKDIDVLTKENEELKEKLNQINQVVGIFSHHSGDTGYGIMLTEIELRKLQNIYNGR